MTKQDHQVASDLIDSIEQTESALNTLSFKTFAELKITRIEIECRNDQSFTLYLDRPIGNTALMDGIKEILTKQLKQFEADLEKL